MFKDFFSLVVSTKTPYVQSLNVLPPYEELEEFERRLREKEKLTFKHIFEEPLGNFVLRQYLKREAFVDHAVFLSDLYTYRSLTTQTVRQRAALRMYSHFLLPMSINHQEDVSVFSEKYIERKPPYQSCNALHFSGYLIHEIATKINAKEFTPTLFDHLSVSIENILKRIFLDFCESDHYRYLIRCKSLELKEISVNAFEILDVIGHGAFGCVHICLKSDTGAFYAVKTISKKRLVETNTAESIMAERDFLATVNSNFVLSLNYAVMDESHIYLVLDLMSGGDIKKTLQNSTFDEKTTQFYAAQIVLGLSHIHEQQIIYRDTKLENVLLDKRGNCQISDLGLAVRVQKVRGYAGTPGYIAPEVILGLYYDQRVDFFSFGVMLYRMLLGKKPFEGPKVKGKPFDSADFDKSTVACRPAFPRDKLSENAIDLLQGLLMKDPNQRLVDFDEIKAHPFFADLDFGMLEAAYIKPPKKVKTFRKHVTPPPKREEGDVGKPIPVEEINARLLTFGYKSKKTIQNELLRIFEYFEQIDEDCFYKLLDGWESHDILRKKQEEEEKKKIRCDCCTIC